jgi:hypothetical protein
MVPVPGQGVASGPGCLDELPGHLGTRPGAGLLLPS